MLYPNNIKKKNSSTISYANRGMDLENLINESNKYYLDNDIAVIYKKPTPIQINKVSYSSGKPEVVKGRFNQKSTLDYVGIYKGKYIDFDAKKTLNRASFPLDNIHSHQIEHIKRIIRHGGIAFLIIEINNEIYLLPGEDLLNYISTEKRKSIPINYIKEYGLLIKYGYNPVIDYLSTLDRLIERRNKNGQEEK